MQVLKVGRNREDELICLGNSQMKNLTEGNQDKGGQKTFGLLETRDIMRTDTSVRHDQGSRLTLSCRQVENVPDNANVTL